MSRDHVKLWKTLFDKSLEQLENYGNFEKAVLYLDLAKEVRIAHTRGFVEINKKEEEEKKLQQHLQRFTTMKW